MTDFDRSKRGKLSVEECEEDETNLELYSFDTHDLSAVSQNM